MYEEGLQGNTLILRFPVEAREVGAPPGCLAIDRCGVGWLEADDIYIVGEDEDTIVVQLTLTPEEVALIEAFYRGEHLHYDEDHRSRIREHGRHDGYGGPEAEIVWAVRYWGGLKAYGRDCPLCATVARAGRR